MERRELLKHVGVAAGAGAAGVAGVAAFDYLDEPPGTDGVEDLRETPRGELPAEYTDRFETVVDAASAGADPDGNDPINDFLTEYAAEDTLLSFRPGTYRLQPAVLSGLSEFGIVGIGDERPTIVPSDAQCHPGDAHLMFEAVEDLLLEDVDFDFDHNGTGGAIQVFAQGDVTLRNLDLIGNCPNQIASLRVDIREADAEGLVENLVARDETGDSKLTGVYVGKHHSGSLTFRDCEIRGFSDNGLYASSPGHPGGGNGDVEVVGGTYEDNNISNVRLGTSGSVARGVTVEIADPTPLNGAVNARGIRLRERGNHVVEDCEITIAEGVEDSLGAIVFHPDAATAEIRDTEIAIDAEAVPGINAFAPSERYYGGPLVENVSIRGSAPSGYAVSVTGRDKTVIRDCTIDQNGHARGGIRLADADECRIVDTQITTTGAPVSVDDGDVTIEDTTIATPRGTRTIDSLDVQDGVVLP